MPKSYTARMRLLGSAAVIGLFGAMMGTAQAVETKFGELSITFDTTVSMGASMRTADRETAFLSEGNGGNVDPRRGPGDSLVVIGPGFIPNLCTDAVVCPLFGASGKVGEFAYTSIHDNFDGSVNLDDGRLNWDNGDLIGANVKANHDLVVKWRNYTLFGRAVGFYDVILNDGDAGNRSLLTDKARGGVGRNYELLDLFVDANYDFAGMPVDIRVGKQVINWGESTFILGGNNVFNPINVAAFRRPGSEIKEALLPVTAISGSITLPDDFANISIAGYYGLDFQPFNLDPSGTPFSGADVIKLGSGIGGNVNRVSFLSGSPFSGERRNCLALARGATGTRFIQTSGLINDPVISTVGKLDCTDDNFAAPGSIFFNTIDYRTPYTIGRHEEVKLGLAGILSASDGLTQQAQGVVDFGGERLPPDTGDFGLSARYIADWAGGAEFGFYYQNYTSRLPFVSEKVGGFAELGIATVSDQAQFPSGIGSRTLLPAGCGFTSLAADDPATAGAIANGTANFVNSLYGDAGAPTPLDGIGLDNTHIADPQNILNAGTAATAAAMTGGTLVMTTDAFGSYDTVLNAMKLNCLLAFHQSTRLLFGPATPVLLNGAETVTLNSNIDLLVDYPEDIDVYGASFSTTIWGWGVQGDFTYRPHAPFQVDTDSLTIAAAWKNCAFEVGTVAAAAGALFALRTPDASGIQGACIAAGGLGLAAGQTGEVSGVVRNEMFTAQIGTTATFTSSEWWMDMVGADLGILVTEFGVVHVPGVEQNDLVSDGLSTNTAAELASRKNPVYASTSCQGSDLPLGGLLLLDPKKPRQCRPTDTSAGLVLLGRLDYNNAFGSGFLVSPVLTYSYDYIGTTPAPYGNYIQDRQSVSLGVSGTLNNNFRVGANYTNFFGGHINNKARDLDFASVSASYTY